jgi:2'-5' RNA ligase
VPAGALIVTATLDDGAQTRFDELRRRHFPPARNHLTAHVTLFHALPGQDRPTVDGDLAAAAAAVDGPIALQVPGVRFFGRGVAVDLRSARLDAVRAGLARAWQGWLTPQDRQPFRPHVTVQNKVEPAQARALHEALAAAGPAALAPDGVHATGLALWRYLGGPWEPLARYPFGAPAGSLRA